MSKNKEIFATILKADEPWGDGIVFTAQCCRDAVKDLKNQPIPIFLNFDPQKIVGKGKVVYDEKEGKIVMQATVIKAMLKGGSLKGCGFQPQVQAVSAKETKEGRQIEECKLISVGLVKMGKKKEA